VGNDSEPWDILFQQDIKKEKALARRAGMVFAYLHFYIVLMVAMYYNNFETNKEVLI
jgi:sulfur relay (sulfurtransferase) DsrC/TusE family protein